MKYEWFDITEQRIVKVKGGHCKKFVRVPVRGQRVVIQSAKGFEFFVYHHNELDVNEWCVSEMRTGSKVGKGKTRRAAIASAEKACEYMGADRITLAIDRALEKIKQSQHGYGIFIPYKHDPIDVYPKKKITRINLLAGVDE